MNILIENISERDLAKLLGISKTYVHKIASLSSDQQSDHLSDHLSDHNELSKCIKVSMLSGGVVTTGVTTGVTTEVTTSDHLGDQRYDCNNLENNVLNVPIVTTGVTTDKRNADKENTPPTPPIKEINKEKNINLDVMSHSSTLHSSDFCEKSDTAYEIEGEIEGVIVEPDEETVKGESINYKSLVDAWNSQIASAGHIGRITSITKNRRKLVRARIVEYGKESFWKACLNMKESVFFKNKPQFANIDWLARPNNFPKVLDGNYNR